MRFLRSDWPRVADSRAERRSLMPRRKYAAPAAPAVSVASATSPAEMVGVDGGCRSVPLVSRPCRRWLTSVRDVDVVSVPADELPLGKSRDAPLDASEPLLPSSSSRNRAFRALI